MTTLTPTNPSLPATIVNPITPTASDTIPCLAYREVILVVRTAATNTYTGVVNDPNTQGPPGAVQFDPDVSTGSVPVSSTRALKLNCARFRDANGNITITSASTFTGTTLEAFGIQ